ncbi:MAG: bifunctional adenosylcobinamide kinase/adenosylcobinamide-phosphate guanylyltransferase [Chloroflexi bacterium]|nr:MAG: bifunctional adenosylcobinamide kinase/adenosylcobinamide-phosphate guanylyltransferase [Chloroflexota bacterium]
MGKVTLILGGARSGKSTFAEKRASAAANGKVLYIATAQAMDEEMETRIEIHKQERPSHWQTMEIPLNVGQFMQDNPTDAEIVLLDCLTMLVTNVLLKVNPDPDVIDEAASDAAVVEEIEGVKTAVSHHSANWLIVSNEVGLGLVPPYPLGRVYRDTLGRANQMLARAADEVYFLIAGIPMRMVPEE